MSRFLPLLLTAIVASSALKAEEEKITTSYALQFRDGHSSGSWMFVINNRITCEITGFSNDSNRDAMKALSALHPEIVRLNTNPEHNIYLVGELKKVKEGALKAGQAQMRLDGWYIKVPFYLPPETDPDGRLRLATVLTTANFLPPGERPDSDATRKLRSSLVINHDTRLNLFWFGAKSPFSSFLEKEGE